MENLYGRVIKTITEYSVRKSEIDDINFSKDWVDPNDPWTMDFDLNSGGKIIKVRHIKEGDIETLKSFSKSLSETSKDLFCPYPWDSEKIDGAFKGAIDAATRKQDVSYVILSDEEPVGHFFLWKAGGNDHSKQHGVDIPELGVAIADQYHGKGLGWLSVKLLQDIAHTLNRDAIELTTAMSNNAGWNTYLKTGFEYLDVIRNPLEVDVTAAISGEIHAEKFREERQMVYIVNKEKEAQIKEYLSLKRQEAESK